MREFFEQNQTIILFAQGLVFFSLGFAVWIQRRRASRLVLTNALIWLAAFAFVEAFAVWGQAFIPIQDGYLRVELVDALWVLRAVLQTGAFVFLLQFALRLMVRSRRRRSAYTALSVAGWLTILTVTAVVAGTEAWGMREWEGAAVASSRLLLLLPAAVLAAVGLWRHRGELADAGMIGIKPFAAAAAGVLLVYGVLAGVVVDDGPWSPHLLTDTAWFSAGSLPVAALRGLAGLALCFIAIKLLETFEVEAKQRLDALERSRTVAEERARFRRDLHDGTIQNIYAAALHLEAIAIRLPDSEIRQEVRDVVTDLNTVTDDIRRYITDLSQTPDTPTGVADHLTELVDEFAHETGVEADVRVTGVAVCGPIPDGTGRHLEHIVREALSNAARHSRCTSATVALTYAADELELVIQDDGAGMRVRDDGHEGQGLRNMRERARRLGGRLTIEGASSGTRIVVSVPLDSDLPEYVPGHRQSAEVIPS